MDNNENGNITSGENVSYWVSSVEPISYPALFKDIDTDVVVVGGGIAGVSIVFNLARSGKKVVLVDDGNIGSGETGRTTAHAVSVLDDRFYELIRMYGEESTRTIVHSHQRAIDFIEKTVNELNIDCDFERLPGYLFLHPSDKRESLSREKEAAQKAGLSVEELEMIPGSNEKLPCLRFPNQAQFHPLKYLKALCSDIQKNGGEIYTNTHAAKISSQGIETTEGYKVNAKFVVVATNSPVNIKYVMHLKQYAYRTYVIGAKIKKGLAHALWWDTGDFSANKEIPPYHYVRLQNLDDTHDLLIVGGEDHPTGIADDKKVNESDRYALLEAWARERFKIEEIVYQWSGQVLEPMDSVAYIGKNPGKADNVFVATGDSGNGITHGTIAGMLITDLINKKDNEWEKIYSPSRFKIFTAGKTFFKELVGGMLAYYKLKPNNAGHVKLGEINLDEGKIIDVEGEKYAVYRDKNSQLHVLGAECMHLGCIVKWNSDEKTWDCGCHGSRYTHDGKVINGPSNQDLPDFTTVPVHSNILTE